MKAAFFVFVLTMLAAPMAMPQAAAATSKKKSTSKKSRKSSKKAAPVAAWRTRQMAPTPDRYKDIQQALASKGYLKEEPTGIWDDKSAEALRQFQTDQKIAPTGKINAPSLIGLGLGPKSEDAPPPVEPKP